MRVQFEPVGTVEISDELVYRFASGLPGYPKARSFVFLGPPEDLPFAWMVSLDQPDLAFAVADPFKLFPDYHPRLAQEDLAVLGISQQSEALLYTIVTIPDDPGAATANLRAPIALNPGTKTGRQAILAGQEYCTQRVVGGEAIARARAVSSVDAQPAAATSQGGRGPSAGLDP